MFSYVCVAECLLYFNVRMYDASPNCQCLLASIKLMWCYTQGDGVGGAQVFVNGYLAATTDEEGSYTLTNISSGSYHILVCGSLHMYTILGALCVCVRVCVCMCVRVCVCVCVCVKGVLVLHHSLWI